MPRRALMTGVALLVFAGAPGSVHAETLDASASAEFQRAVAHLQTAEVSYDRAQLQIALDTFSKLLADEPKNPTYPYYLARAQFPLINLHDWDGNRQRAEEAGEKGIEYLKKALKLDEAGNPDAYRLLGDFYGRLSLFKGLFGKMKYGSRSITFHQKANDKGPTTFLTVIGSGTDRLYAPSAFGGDVDAAVDLFQKAISIAPEAPQGYLWLAKAYLKQKKYDLAREQFRKAAEVAPESGLVQGEIKVASRENPEMGSVKLASQ
jgi:tetratricopeptide (TPR) repeat protein